MFGVLRLNSGTLKITHFIHKHRSSIYGVAGRFWFGLCEHLRKPRANDTSDLGHEVGDLLPFLRQKILFQLRMNGPLGIDLRSFSANKYP